MTKEKKKNQLNSRSVIVIVLCFARLYESQLAENEELEAAIKDGDKKELAEEYARKKGYVMPDERVYVDVTPGSEE